MKKSAFSLIELSIVILIIGILIAGVTQSSRLISKMRLSAARAQTQSSEANSVKNMVFWLETTSEKSFDDAATEDATSINSTTYSWYDINNQISQRSNAANAAGADYKLNGINSLPVLNFDGTSGDLMDITQSNGLTSQISIFIVFRNLTLPSASSQTLLAVKGVTHVAANNSFQVNINTSNLVQYSFIVGTTVTTASTAAISVNTPYILDIVDDGTTTQTISINGASTMNRVTVGTTGSPSVSIAKNLNLGLNIGYWNNGTTNANFFNGDIGEIIVFDRALKQEERNAIEKYLGKKWGIKTGF